MNDNQLLGVLKNIVRQKTGEANNDQSELVTSVIEPGLVRVVVNSRGGSSFLLDINGGVLQYIVPHVTHEAAIAAFKEGRRSALPDEALIQAGFKV